jgi:hypothetical protein
MDYFVLACEILFVIFTVYYTVEEFIEVIEKFFFILYIREKQIHLDFTI